LVIREVPGYMDSGKEKETILDFMNRTLHSDTAEPEPYDLMAKSVACRSAIRKGSQVSDAIISEILNRLSYCENPARCPHGRPTLVKLTRDDLEKMFHRK
jgi:DNA mismatch repair protein MutL